MPCSPGPTSSSEFSSVKHPSPYDSPARDLSNHLQGQFVVQHDSSNLKAGSRMSFMFLVSQEFLGSVLG